MMVGLKPVDDIPEEEQPTLTEQQRFEHREELGGPAPALYCAICHETGHSALEHPWRSDWQRMADDRYELHDKVANKEGKYTDDEILIVVERDDTTDWDTPDACGKTSDGGQYICARPAAFHKPEVDHEFVMMMVPETIPGWKVWDDGDPAETTTYFRGFDQALREGERLMAFVLENA
jgi:hypothetical protein